MSCSKPDCDCNTTTSLTHTKPGRRDYSHYGARPYSAATDPEDGEDGHDAALTVGGGRACPVACDSGAPEDVLSRVFPPAQCSRTRSAPAIVISDPRAVSVTHWDYSSAGKVGQLEAAVSLLFGVGALDERPYDFTDEAGPPRHLSAAFGAADTGIPGNLLLGVKLTWGLSGESFVPFSAVLSVGGPDAGEFRSLTGQRLNRRMNLRFTPTRTRTGCDLYIPFVYRAVRDEAAVMSEGQVMCAQAPATGGSPANVPLVTLTGVPATLLDTQVFSLTASLMTAFSAPTAEYLAYCGLVAP